MCYILYGAVNKEIDPADCERINAAFHLTIRSGTKHDLKMCILNRTADYRVTDSVCDCDFPFGMNDPTAAEIQALAGLLTAFQKARGAKCIYLCKTWEGQRNKSEETVSVPATELADFLAQAKVNCLYQIQLN